jgi:tRNA A22 N-methylase
LHGNEQQAKIDTILTQIEDNKTAVQQAIDVNSAIGCPTLVLQALYKKHSLRAFMDARSWHLSDRRLLEQDADRDGPGRL